MSTISDMELDHILSCLEKDKDTELSLEDVGSRGWCSKMSMFEEINVQAALEVICVI
jgi:hypothetical protein